jgi:hypothetical protein
LALGCRVSGVGQGPAALIFGASAVAGAAVYRQATGGCWAACNTGWVCNPSTGRCEPEAREHQRRLLRRPLPSSVATARSDVSRARDAGLGDAGSSDGLDGRDAADAGAP